MCITLEYTYPLMLIFLLVSYFLEQKTEGWIGTRDSTRIVRLNCDVYKCGISGFTRGIQLYLKVNTDTQ
jgi:hypothetical protein